MEVKKIYPQGYCKGVILALKKCIEVLNNPNLPKPIYMLGMPIHNQKVSDSLTKKGLIILEGKKRSELLDEIKAGTVITSAHGVSKEVMKKAALKGLHIIDTTCESVHKIQETLRGIQEDILYIGISNHPESEAILTEFPNAKLIETIHDIDTINSNGSYFVTNQTTMSIFDTEEKYTLLKKRCPNIKTSNLICDATTQRQKALVNQKADLIIIVGDGHSSNTQKLYEIALKNTTHKKVLKIETVEDLAEINLTPYQNAIVTSGASTPKAITDEVCEYLRYYPNKKAISNLCCDDYLKLS